MKGLFEEIRRSCFENFRNALESVHLNIRRVLAFNLLDILIINPRSFRQLFLGYTLGCPQVFDFCAHYESDIVHDKPYYTTVLFY